eukprot:TRINITY_DN5149_c0_g1_i5.p1 TRINITY_DN5149_c0_g1~~TRINITY_DN5149_c0_g1_i5.p1  ORF type:complete len:768 (+),score=102.18 TRINITY_DN5149_c0_g1_i5:70-2373(+)
MVLISEPCSMRRTRSNTQEASLIEGVNLEKAKAAFLKSLQHEGIKFEVLYVILVGLGGVLVRVAESIIVIWDVGEGSGQVIFLRLHSLLIIVLPVSRGLLLWYRIRKDPETRQTEGLCSVVITMTIDVLIFSSVATFGFVTAKARIVSGFFTNIFLSYTILITLPLNRCRIFAPVCLLFYAFPVVFAPRFPIDMSLYRQWIDVALMALALCLNLTTRTLWERSRWNTYLALQQRTWEVIQQKVLRCQAEFASDITRSKVLGGTDRRQLSSTDDSSYILSYSGDLLATAPNGAITASKNAIEALHGDGFLVPSHLEDMRAPPAPSTHYSLRSAPAVLQSDVDGGVGNDGAVSVASDGVVAVSALCEGADCLPPEAMVWTEGDALPQPVERVVRGQRVLCFDRLGGHLKHAAVLEAKRSESATPTEWARVRLIDGTSLSMTADHPVKPVGLTVGQGVPAGPFCDVRPTVAARELRPGVDKLLVLKVVPEEVSEVELFSDVGPHVFLTVQQPERHAIFVADKAVGGEAGGRALLQPVAVESANGKDQGQLRFGVSRTFLEAFGCGNECKSGREEHRRRHPKSAPSIVGAKVADVGVQSLRVTTDVSEDTLSNPSDGDSDALACGSAEETEAVVVGPAEVDSSEHVHETFVATEKSSDHPVAAAFASSASCVRLSDLLAMKAAGLPSFGSVRHSQGSCKMCIFENRAQHHGASTCFKGTLCDRCHEIHKPYRSALKDRRRLRRNQAQHVGGVQASSLHGMEDGEVLCNNDP